MCNTSLSDNSSSSSSLSTHLHKTCANGFSFEFMQAALELE